MRVLLAVLTIILSQTVTHAADKSSATTTVPRAPAAAPSAAGTVRTDSWAKSFEVGVAARLCGRDGFFATCYQIKPDDCRKQVVSMTNRCIQAQRLPARLDRKRDIPVLGQKIGTCVGTQFGTANRKRAIASVSCQAGTRPPAQNRAPARTQPQSPAKKK